MTPSKPAAPPAETAAVPSPVARKALKSKKAKAMRPLVVRVPAVLLRIVRHNAKTHGQDVSTHVRDLLASYSRPAADAS